jgi:hypothetical protein
MEICTIRRLEDLEAVVDAQLSKYVVSDSLVSGCGKRHDWDIRIFFPQLTQGFVLDVLINRGSRSG